MKIEVTVHITNQDAYNDLLNRILEYMKNRHVTKLEVKEVG